MQHPTSALRVLAESSRYVLGHVYEQVYVVEKGTGVSHDAGQHYGDPACGLIDPDETWFIAGGEGLTLFTFCGGVVELLRGRRQVDTCFVTKMRLEVGGTVRVLVDPWSDKASVWRVFPGEVRIEKLGTGPDLRSEPWREDVEY